MSFLNSDLYQYYYSSYAWILCNFEYLAIKFQILSSCHVDFVIGNSNLKRIFSLIKDYYTMEKVLLSLAAITLLGSMMFLNNTTVVEDDSHTQFQAFKKQFNKKYGAQEDNYRYEVFRQTLAEVAAFNQAKGEEQMGITLFADLTHEEFQATYLTQIQETETLETVEYSAEGAADTLDWRTSGRVTDIKNQGQCGSCWAFSTTGVLEGFFHKTTGTLPSLSEQQLVDCAGILYGNLGCNGGMPSRALNYVKAKGITTEAAYPYKAVKGSCTTQGGSYKISGQNAVAASDAGLVGALQNHPVSVAVDATNWKNYVSGVFSDCDTALNHAVLAVGYGKDHYIVKNSWTTGWGEAGYIRLARANTCGVLNTMVVPV